MFGLRRKSQPDASSTTSRLRGSKNSIIGRCKSMPSMGKYRNVKGVMKYITADESVHSTYGESKDSEDSRQRTIEFKDIHIREYARTVGDNPSCSSGPPITIAWEHTETKKIPVDQYEESRPPRRSHFEMVLPRDVRQQMLRKEWEVTQSQIAAAVRSNIKVKNQRRSTVNNLGKATKMEEMMEKAGKKVIQGLLFKKSTSKQVKDLEEQLEAAEIARQQLRLEENMQDENGDKTPSEETMRTEAKHDDEAKESSMDTSESTPIVGDEPDDEAGESKMDTSKQLITCEEPDDEAEVSSMNTGDNLVES